MHRVRLIVGHLKSTEGSLKPEFVAAKQDKPDRLSFDYIVVGGGNAGCVVARRLAEDPKVTVLLIEAGPPDPNFFVECPGTFRELQRGDRDWSFETVPQKHIYNRVGFCPRGKMFGGSTSINAMFYVRGDPQNFDDWAAQGCTGWGYKDVLPYFKKAERCEGVADAAEGFHGTDGPIPTTVPNGGGKGPSVWSRRFMQAGIEVGIPHNRDYNGPSQTGIGIGQLTVSRSGNRVSSAAGYLPWLRDGGQGPRNLTIVGCAHVERVLFQADTAIGVSYRDGTIDIKSLRLNRRGEFYSKAALARKEVILCAGAINTPWLLMLSGVGPADELKRHNIPVVKEVNGVGRKLRDHVLVPVHYRVNDSESWNKYLKMLSFNFVSAMSDYFFFGRGPFTTGGLEVSAFLNSELRKKEFKNMLDKFAALASSTSKAHSDAEAKAKSTAKAADKAKSDAELVQSAATTIPSPLEADAAKEATKAAEIAVAVAQQAKEKAVELGEIAARAAAVYESMKTTRFANDLQLHFIPATFDEKALATGNIAPDVYTKSDQGRKESILPEQGILFLPSLLLPKSEGRITLQSTNPFTYPNIDPNYLAHPDDLEVLVEGMKLCRRIANAPSLKGLVGEEVIIPGVPHPPESDEYLREVARRTCLTIFHPTTTCKMGPDGDPEAVVDLRLRVRGLKRLRIVDASIMPEIVSGNTMAAVYMIAEKAADMIKQDNE